MAQMSQNFAQWFVAQLRRREWNQSDFARRTDVPQTTVSAWSRGIRLPDPASCDKIADAFLLPLDDVLVRAGHRPADTVLPPGDPRSHLTALVGRVRWTPERQGAVEALMRQWIEYDRQKG